jgi:hypothetical protein
MGFLNRGDSRPKIPDRYLGAPVSKAPPERPKPKLREPYTAQAVRPTEATNVEKVVQSSGSTRLSASPLDSGQRHQAVVGGRTAAESQGPLSDFVPSSLPGPMQEIARSLLESHTEWEKNWARMDINTRTMLTTVSTVEVGISEQNLRGAPLMKERYAQVSDRLSLLDACMQGGDEEQTEVDKAIDYLTKLRSSPDTAASADRVVLSYFIRELFDLKQVQDGIAKSTSRAIQMRYLPPEEIARLDIIMGVIKRYLDETPEKTGDGTGELFRLYIKALPYNTSILGSIFEHYKLDVAL